MFFPINQIITIFLYFICIHDKIYNIIFFINGFLKSL